MINSVKNKDWIGISEVVQSINTHVTLGYRTKSDENYQKNGLLLDYSHVQTIFPLEPILI